MFDREEHALQLLQNISGRLVKNGMFICIIPDSNVIVKRMRHHYSEQKDANKPAQGPFVVKNQYYSMRFDQIAFDKRQLYGLGYGFYL